MLNPEEILSIKDQLIANQSNYLRASELIRETCLRFKTQRPQVLRAVFPREPPVKTFESIVAKIEKQRKEDNNPRYGFTSLNDIVALTALCAYETDVAEFIRWMKGVFDVVNSDQDAERNTGAGHRAFHYIVRLKRGQATYDLAAVRCELQVKTILQEAFDAKAHDLAYKPKKLKVSEEMNRQFSLLSTLLRSIDGQSEFLKDLILRGKRELALRREACVLLYFKQPEVKKIAEELNLDVHDLPETSKLASILEQGEKRLGVSREFCKLTALCAVKCDADYLRAEARRYADIFVEQAAREARRYLVRGSVKWLIGHIEDGIRDVLTGLDMGKKQSADATVVEQSKNNLVYFVADWKAYEGNEREEFNQAAKVYAEEIRANPDEKTTDTLGLYLIAFGETEDEVEQGRAYLRKALKERSDDPSYLGFYRLHEFIALRKLLEMALQLRVSYD